MAQSRSYPYTLGPKVVIIDQLGALGYGGFCIGIGDYDNRCSWSLSEAKQVLSKAGPTRLFEVMLPPTLKSPSKRAEICATISRFQIR